MSLRLEMLQVARLAPKILGESTGLVRDFLFAQQNPDGGFKDRTGKSDLYYTVFGIDALLALPAQPNLETLKKYLNQFGVGEGLDFVHLCCLARCWAALGNLESGRDIALPDSTRDQLVRRIDTFRSEDGGYHPVAGHKHGTAYGCFLGFGAHLDLRVELPEPLRMIQCLKFLETSDGAWGNERGVKMGATNSTAAAVTVLRNLGAPVNGSVGEWLVHCCQPTGGFLAMPLAPIPDLLSTATALHALAGLQISIDAIKEPCLDFVDTLWTNEGSFHGNWTDEHLDCEYSFYGLLALGHLSL